MLQLALLAFAPAFALPSVQPAAAPLQGGGPPSVSDVERAVDGSLRWLRERQDAKDGSYGDASTTARVLAAFAGSHRAYRVHDGPFVGRALEWLLARQRTDGAFAAEGTTGEEALVPTVDAALALELLGTERAAAALERARAFLGAPAAAEASPEPLSDLPTDALVDRIAALLAERGQDGTWGAAETPAAARTGTTAENVFELSRLGAELKTRGEPRSRGEAEPLPGFSPADEARALEAMGRGAAFLLEAADDGRWGFPGHPDPGITAMVTGALLGLPEPREAAVQEAIDGALDWLISLQKPDGSIHAGQLANYVTSASVLALSAAGREDDRPVIARARRFLQHLQADEGEGYARGDRFYGGVGYGGDERPDLSNMQMALEALAAAGLEPKDATFEKALVFLQRCQNRSESNDLVVAGDTLASGDDGGAGYAPGDSKAGFVELRDGRRVPRSYGSMTYALLKGYLFAGLPKEDPRVEAAWSWIRANYTLDVNPGFEASDDPVAGYQGLFYYFYTMARALDLYGTEVVEDAAGREHPWRQELAGRLVSMQRQDGSWVNANASRWYEGNPVLATSYALLTLRTAAAR